MAQEKTVQQGYEVEGTVVTTLKEVGSILGVSTIKTKDIEEGGKYADQVNLVDLGDEDWEQPQKVEVQEKHPMEKPESKEGEVYSELSDEDYASLEDVDKKDIESSFGEPESLEELKETIKEIDTATLEYLARGLDLDWKPTYHANIHRMRIAMEIQKHFFPELFKPKEKKKQSKYGDYSTQQLLDIADKEKVEFKKTGNERIDRMKVITALKESGHLAE